jgi:exodeoxyribonuclease VII large subunit
MSEILTVSQLTRELKDCLEGNFAQVAVVGEVSGCTHASSGHVYFTLKDEAAQLRVVLWRRSAARVRFELVDGLELVAVGAIELYAPRGMYQLVASELIPQGIGPLELAFRQLHDRLKAAGLFDAARKRPLPRFSRRIALITSPTGAAIRDMLQVITRRWRGADLVLLPVAVQGAEAAPQISAALSQVGRIPGVDVVILGRGGGSLEDLWAFNEEQVARAIAAAAVPVVSAVGHEIDVTIADLVADRRALTPSEAGELVVPDAAELQEQLRHFGSRLGSALRERARSARRQWELLAGRRVFTRPFDRLRWLEEQLDEWHLRLNRAVRAHHQQAAARVAALAGSLHALSPLQVLERGYSLTQRAATGELVRTAAQLQVGDSLVTRLHQGTVRSRVEALQATAPDEPPSNEAESRQVISSPGLHPHADAPDSTTPATSRTEAR